LAVESSGDLGLDTAVTKGVRNGKSEVYAVAGLESKKLSVMVYNYFDDDVPGPAAAVDLALANLPANGQAKLTEYRIDQDHSNAHTVWQKMGSPQSPTPQQYAELKQAGQLETLGDSQIATIVGGNADLKITLPRQAVSLLVLEWN
jgi:xylan 1,4-beta-xylosidase